MIKWIDRRSVLAQGRKKYAFGATIPEGILSAERLDLLVSQKKIRIESEAVKKVEPKPEYKPAPKPEKKSEPKPEPKIEDESDYDEDEEA